MPAASVGSRFYTVIQALCLPPATGQMNQGFLRLLSFLAQIFSVSQIPRCTLRFFYSPKSNRNFHPKVHFSPLPKFRRIPVLQIKNSAQNLNSFICYLTKHFNSSLCYLTKHFNSSLCYLTKHSTFSLLALVSSKKENEWAELGNIQINKFSFSPT